METQATDHFIETFGRNHFCVYRGKRFHRCVNFGNVIIEIVLADSLKLTVEKNVGYRKGKQINLRPCFPCIICQNKPDPF